MQSLVSTINLSLTFWKLAHNLKEDFFPTHEDLEVSGPSALLIEGKKLHCSLKAYLIAYAFVHFLHGLPSISENYYLHCSFISEES